MSVARVDPRDLPAELARPLRQPASAVIDALGELRGEGEGEGIGHKMLAQNLRMRERNGLAERRRTRRCRIGPPPLRRLTGAGTAGGSAIRSCRGRPR
nr:hypothetical protein [Nonomuraea sp. FMUSA5-5]